MAALKAVLKSLEGLADPIKALYKQEGEEFHLDVEGMVPKSQLDEFRETNRGLHKQVEDLTAGLKKFEGVDLKKWTDLQETERKVKDKQLIDAGKIDDLIASRLEPIKKEFQTQLDTEKKRNEQLSGRLETMQIDDQLTKLGTTKGLRPSAIEDMIARGRRVFKLQDGKVVAVGQDGATLLTKQGEPMTMDRWVEQLSSDAPHLFQASTGSGAPPNQPSNQNGAKQITRGEFDKLNPSDKAKFIKDQGKVVDAA